MPSTLLVLWVSHTISLPSWDALTQSLMDKYRAKKKKVRESRETISQCMCSVITNLLHLNKANSPPCLLTDPYQQYQRQSINPVPQSHLSVWLLQKVWSDAATQQIAGRYFCISVAFTDLCVYVLWIWGPMHGVDLAQMSSQCLSGFELNFSQCCCAGDFILQCGVLHCFTCLL